MFLITNLKNRARLPLDLYLLQYNLKSLILLKKNTNQSKPNSNHPLEAENPSTNDFRRKAHSKSIKGVFMGWQHWKRREAGPIFLNSLLSTHVQKSTQFSLERLFKTRGNTLFHIDLLLFLKVNTIELFSNRELVYVAYWLLGVKTNRASAWKHLQHILKSTSRKYRDFWCG